MSLHYMVKTFLNIHYKFDLQIIMKKIIKTLPDKTIIYFRLGENIGVVDKVRKYP